MQKQTPESSRSVTYSISQIIKFVNSGDLLRYIPDEMLTEEQKPTKYEAIAKTIEKTNIKRFTYRYIIDDEGVVHVFEREKAKNIHE